MHLSRAHCMRCALLHYFPPSALLTEMFYVRVAYNNLLSLHEQILELRLVRTDGCKKSKCYLNMLGVKSL